MSRKLDSGRGLRRLPGRFVSPRGHAEHEHCAAAGSAPHAQRRAEQIGEALRDAGARETALRTCRSLPQSVRRAGRFASAAITSTADRVAIHAVEARRTMQPHR